MRSEWLAYFSDAVRLGSIKASANMHNISPQGLSKAIRSLENELHVTLFERGANSIRLTAEGVQLLPTVQEVVQGIRELELQAGFLADNRSAKPFLVLCSTFVFLCGMIEPLREGMKDLGDRATCMQMDSAHMLEELAGKSDPYFQGKALCGFPLLFTPSDDGNRAVLDELLEGEYDYIPLIAYHDGIMVSKDHPLAERETVSKQDIAKYPVISSSAEQLPCLTRYLDASHIQTAIVNLSTRLQMILDNESIIFLPPFADAIDDDAYRFIRLAEPYDVELGFVFDETKIRISDMEPVLEAVIQHYRRYESEGRCCILYHGL